MLRKLVEYADAGDFEAIAELPIHPEFEFHSMIGATEGRVFRGPEELRLWRAETHAVWDEYRVTTEAVQVFDERTAVITTRLSGVARASGVPLDQVAGQLITLEDGLIRRIVTYANAADAVEAAQGSGSPPG